MVGEPCAANPHARFDEGEQETGPNRRRACSLLYQRPRLRPIKARAGSVTHANRLNC